MEVLNPRAALLSNYEVLTLLRELESDHLLRTKAALRVKKEEEAGLVNGALAAGGNPHLEASENLRTIEVEAIGYLSADYLPTTSQTEEGIAKLVKKLASYELTKAEKLQIVNLAPTQAVELYVIVEELEDRFGDKIDEILDHVRDTLSTQSQTTASGTAASTTNGQGAETTGEVIVEENSAWDDDADAVYDEEEFDDTGAGAGIEGDLEMDED